MFKEAVDEIIDSEVESWNWLALDRLVRDLHGEANGSYITYDIFNEFNALYPFFGGIGGSHSLNLIDPQLFKLTFHGSPGHSDNGVQFNGASWANTDLTPSVYTDMNNLHLSVYSRTDIVGNEIEIGSYFDPTPGDPAGPYLIYSFSGSPYKAFNSNENVRGSLFTPTQGLLMGNRIDANTEKYFHKGVLKDVLSQPSTNTSQLPIYIGACNYHGTASFFSRKQIAFCSIGNGWSDAEATFIHNAVHAYQIALGRAV